MGLGWGGEEGKDASCSKGMTVMECRERDTPACIFLLLPAKEAGTPVHIHSTSIYGGMGLFCSPCQALLLHSSCLEPAESWQQTEFKSSDLNEGTEDDYGLGLKDPIGADAEAPGEWREQEAASISVPEGVKEGSHVSRVPENNSPGGTVKNPPPKAGDVVSVPGSGRSPRVRSGYPLQYSCLEDPMDRGAWRATVHRIAKELNMT